MKNISLIPIFCGNYNGTSNNGDNSWRKVLTTTQGLRLPLMASMNGEAHARKTDHCQLFLWTLCLSCVERVCQQFRPPGLPTISASRTVNAQWDSTKWSFISLTDSVETRLCISASKGVQPRLEPTLPQTHVQSPWEWRFWSQYWSYNKWTAMWIQSVLDSVQDIQR